MLTEFQIQNAFFDVRVTNPDSNSQRDSTLDTIMKRHEGEKKRQYNKRVMEVEHGTFTPLVFTTKGVMGPECSIFHRSLAQKLSEKKGERYEDTTRYIRVKISFLALKSTLQCIRGSRKMYNDQETGDDFSLHLTELGL